MERKCLYQLLSTADVLRDQQISLKQASAFNLTILEGNGIRDAIVKQSGPRKRVVVEMLAFFCNAKGHVSYHFVIGRTDLCRCKCTAHLQYHFANFREIKQS